MRLFNVLLAYPSDPGFSEDAVFNEIRVSLSAATI
jgi:hypothetical protein